MLKLKSNSETQLNSLVSDGESVSYADKTMPSSKQIQKPKSFLDSCSQWITGGDFGSPDTVLVFRTDVLNSKDNDNELSDTITMSSSTSSIENTIKDHIDELDSKKLSMLPKSDKKNVNLKSENCPKSSSDSVFSKNLSNPSPKKHSSNIKCFSKSSDYENEKINDKENNCNEYDCINRLDMPASLLNITYKFINTESRILKKIFHSHGLCEAEEDQNFSILWTGAHMKPDILRNLLPYQRVNHFPRSYELTRKDRLYKNIEKMQHLRGIKNFDIVPQSFMLPLELRDLITAHNKCRGPWIVKPAALSRGRGIFLVNSPEEIKTEEQLLVSQYIADPLCIDGHKCDLRVYVAVTSFDPLVIYIYEEGLVRLATVKYERSSTSLWNPCMHLCNYSINKYHSDYIKSSDADDEDVGHKWTLSALLRHLKNQNCDTKKLMLNIEDVIIKSMFACAHSIISACRMFVPNGNNCFELFGFDILIDDTLKPWLLEINLSPSLGIDTPLDAKVKGTLLTDLLTLVGIPAYGPIVRADYDNKWNRFRSINCRRTNSAENTKCKAKKSTLKKVCYSHEELRIIKNVKQQYLRRGGFVRVFPTYDSMTRYSTFLDPVTGIPISTVPGQSTHSMSVQHNYNQMLFNHLFKDNTKNRNRQIDNRMDQYERTLESSITMSFLSKKQKPKCLEEGRRLRRQIRKLIENGNELTQLQSRQAFSSYLECIIKRLREEPKISHELLILNFINRVRGNVKPPPNLKSQLQNTSNKDRSALIARLLGNYLEKYNRETEAYIDNFDTYGMIPTQLFNEFLLNAMENDLESILTLHTNYTHSMPFFYNRCGVNAPKSPPIPSGLYGFLKALPSMVGIGVYSRNSLKSDTKDGNKFYNREKEIDHVSFDNVFTKKDIQTAAS